MNNTELMSPETRIILNDWQEMLTSAKHDNDQHFKTMLVKHDNFDSDISLRTQRNILLIIHKVMKYGYLIPGLLPVLRPMIEDNCDEEGQAVIRHLYPRVLTRSIEYGAK